MESHASHGPRGPASYLLTYRRPGPSEARPLDWDSHRPFIEDLWLNHGLVLDDVRHAMKTVFDFRGDYKTRLKKWELRKNKPRSVGGRLVGFPSGRRHGRLGPKKASRELSRAKSTIVVRYYAKMLDHARLLVPERASSRALAGVDFHLDGNSRRLHVSLCWLCNYLRGCPENDATWRVSKYELVGRCQSMVINFLAVESILPRNKESGCRRSFREDAFAEMEREFGRIRSSIQMWECLISVPLLLVLEDRMDLLEEYLRRLWRLSAEGDSPLRRITYEILCLFLEGGKDAMRQFLVVASAVWAEKLVELRGAHDRSTLDARYVSASISRQLGAADSGKAGRETVEHICSEMEKLREESREENGETDITTLGIEGAYLNTQWALGFFLPDFDERSIELAQKLRRRNRNNHRAASSWAEDDKYLYFRTYYRLSDFFADGGRLDRARECFQLCQWLSHDLRLRGYSMAVHDVRFKLRTLGDIREYKRLGAEFSNLPEPSDLADPGDLADLLGRILLQHRDASLYT